MKSTGRSGIPRLSRSRRAIGSKGCVQMAAAMMPLPCNSAASWILHDVHAPQSPEPVKTTSHSFASASMISGAAGVAAFALRRTVTLAAP
jgi:hypothetical protein